MQVIFPKDCKVWTEFHENLFNKVDEKTKLLLFPWETSRRTLWWSLVTSWEIPELIFGAMYSQFWGSEGPRPYIIKIKKLGFLSSLSYFQENIWRGREEGAASSPLFLNKNFFIILPFLIQGMKKFSVNLNPTGTKNDQRAKLDILTFYSNNKICNFCFYFCYTHTKACHWKHLYLM